MYELCVRVHEEQVLGVTAFALTVNNSERHISSASTAEEKL